MREVSCWQGGGARRRQHAAQPRSLACRLLLGTSSSGPPTHSLTLEPLHSIQLRQQLVHHPVGDAGVVVAALCAHKGNGGAGGGGGGAWRRAGAKVLRKGRWGRQAGSRAAGACHLTTVQSQPTSTSPHPPTTHPPIHTPPPPPPVAQWRRTRRRREARGLQPLRAQTRRAPPPARGCHRRRHNVRLAAAGRAVEQHAGAQTQRGLHG